jgi:uncharacterized protein
VRYKLVDEKPKTFVLVFETNDELSQGLKKFASELKLASASFKAIGALSSVKLGWLNWETKKYEPSVSLNEQVELLSLIGDVALKDGEPQVHAHVVIGKRDGTAHGGHLLQAHVQVGADGEPRASEEGIRSGSGHCSDQPLAAIESSGSKARRWGRQEWRRTWCYVRYQT